MPEQYEDKSKHSNERFNKDNFYLNSFMEYKREKNWN